MSLENELINLHADHYPNGNLKLILLDQHHEPIAEISIYPHEITLLSDEFLLKNYSENTDFVKRLVDTGKIFPTNHFILLNGKISRIYKSTLY
jgi:hypothetical protein